MQKKEEYGDEMEIPSTPELFELARIFGDTAGNIKERYGNACIDDAALQQRLSTLERKRIQSARERLKTYIEKDKRRFQEAARMQAELFARYVCLLSMHWWNPGFGKR